MTPGDEFPLTVDIPVYGPDGSFVAMAPNVLPRPWRTLPGGERGYFQRSHKGCQEAAVATVLQVELEEVPQRNPLAILSWAESRGLEMRLHEEPQYHLRRWIVGLFDERVRNSHAVVMEYDRFLHDPASGFVLPAGIQRAPTFLGRTFHHAYSFTPKETS